MEIRFEFRSGEVINGVSVYANQVYVGDLINIAQDNLMNWCCIQSRGDIKFALRNEETFGCVLNAIKSYIHDNGYGGFVISSYPGGIVSYYSEDFWNKHGFWQRENVPSSLYFFDKEKIFSK